MDTKNTKSKSVQKSASKKQSGGSTENVGVQSANAIVENKLENKVVEVKKTAKKSVEKVTPSKTEVPQTGGKSSKTEKKVTKKQDVKVASEGSVATASTAATKSTKTAKSSKAETTEGSAKTTKSAKAAKEAKPAKAVRAAKEVVNETGAEEDDDEDLRNNKLRYFKLIYNNEIQGRYCGKKPKQAANKAFSSIIKDYKKTGGENGGVNLDINFSIRECTRNSKHKEYKYIGKRQVLENPVKVKIANVDGSIKQIEYKFHNKLQKAPKV